MYQRFLALALMAAPAGLAAQEPAHADTLHQPADSLTRRAITLEAVTVTSAPARREEPSGAVHVSPALIERTPAADAYDLLRQTAGLEVHEQGQGPGFASDASLRGFSSDHSTDIALWVDGVPNNEPVNGHAEGYNDWSLLFPQAIQDVDVLKGPTSALYGNFALAGVVNVRTRERMHGTTAWLDPGSYGRAEGVVLTGLDHGADGSAVFGLRGVREDGWRRHSGYDLGQGHARLVRALSALTTLDAGVETRLSASDPTVARPATPDWRAVLGVSLALSLVALFALSSRAFVLGYFDPSAGLESAAVGALAAGLLYLIGRVLSTL